VKDDWSGIDPAGLRSRHSRHWTESLSLHQINEGPNLQRVILIPFDYL